MATPNATAAEVVRHVAPNEVPVAIHAARVAIHVVPSAAPPAMMQPILSDDVADALAEFPPAIQVEQLASPSRDDQLWELREVEQAQSPAPVVHCLAREDCFLLPAGGHVFPFLPA